MSSIRRQSIISSIIVYFGFALGMFNTYLFTRQGGLTKEEFGLTGLFIAFANIMFSVASLGMPSYISKFFPYYKAHVPDQKNDQISWALLFPCLGFLAVLLAGLVFKSILVDKIFNNSPQLLQYYYWTFPFGFGYTLFMVLEAYAWQQRRSAMSNLLREVVFRFIVTVLIVLVTLHYIRNFETFIAIYAFSYLALVIFMLVYFYRRGQLNITFTKSQVTKRFYAKILTLVGFVWGGSLVFNIASVFDTIVIAAVIPNGVAAVGIFTVAQNLSSLMQAPQRAVISAAVGPISQAWRNKDYKKIRTIYQRSSINQLIFASAMFCLIWLNFTDGLQTFHIQGDFQAAKWVFFYLAMTRIVDMGTGLNSQIIGNSTYWRFEFVSGLILLALMLTSELAAYQVPWFIGACYIQPHCFYDLQPDPVSFPLPQISYAALQLENPTGPFTGRICLCHCLAGWQRWYRHPFYPAAKCCFLCVVWSGNDSAEIISGRHSGMENNVEKIRA
jgi:hypothetical protein